MFISTQVTIEITWEIITKEKREFKTEYAIGTDQELTMHLIYLQMQRPGFTVQVFKSQTVVVR